MPEGPEVKILVEKINKKLKNKTLNNIEFLYGRYLKHGPPKNFDDFTKILPIKIKEMKCKGKFIWIELYNSDFIISNTLGMTGFWTTNDDLKHNNIKFTLNNKIIYFNDVRNFGTINFINIEDLNKKLNTLGPDVLEDYDLNEFKRRLNKKRDDTKISTALLDQKVISGVGNYLRNDILWYTKISPHRKIESLTDEEIELIYENSILLTKRAFYIEKDIKLSNEFNDLKEFKRFFLVYAQDQDYYNNEIIREKISGRTVHWCPEYQK